MRIRIKKRDILWNYIGTIINMFSNFVLIPIILYWLNDEEYGLWCVFLSVGGITTLFDFGFNVTFARNITYCWSGIKELKKESVKFETDKEIDYDLLSRLVSTCKTVYLILSSFALAVIAVFGTAYIIFVSKDTGEKNILASWGIYCVAVFLNLLFGYYNSFLRGIGDIEGLNKAVVVSKVIYIGMTSLLLSMSFGLVGVSLAYLVCGITFRIVSKSFLLKHDKFGKALTRRSSPDKALFATIWHNAWREGMVQSADYLCNQLTVIIASFYCTLTETGAYSLCLQISQAIMMVAAVIYSSFQPELQSAYANRDSEGVKNVFSLVLCSCIGVSVLGAVFLATIAQRVLFILRPTIVLDAPLAIGVLCYQFIVRIRNCYTTYLSSTNRVIYAKSFLASGILTVLSSFILVGVCKMGIWGLVVGQMISQAIYNLWYWPYMVHKELELSFYELLERALKQVKNYI